MIKRGNDRAKEVLESKPVNKTSPQLKCTSKRIVASGRLSHRWRCELDARYSHSGTEHERCSNHDPDLASTITTRTRHAASTLLLPSRRWDRSRWRRFCCYSCIRGEPVIES